jgi:hypothetical protein
MDLAAAQSLIKDPQEIEAEERSKYEIEEETEVTQEQKLSLLKEWYGLVNPTNDDIKKVLADKALSVKGIYIDY